MEFLSSLSVTTSNLGIMPLIKKLLYFIILSPLLASCIERFNPEGLRNDPTLFIQALVTDNPNVTPFVRISYTDPLFLTSKKESAPRIPVSGATVYLERNDGVIDYFTGGFDYNGEYYLTDPAFGLEEGYSYKLIIEASTGEIFESSFEEYLPSPPIEEVSYNYSVESPNEFDDPVEGYRFNVSASGIDSEDYFFRWDIDATYRIFVPYESMHMVINGGVFDTTNYKVMFCYKDDDIKGIYLGSTLGLTEKRIKNSPLHFVSQYGDDLMMLYSLHTYQYRISSRAFQFWWDLRRLTYETGGLYEIQPFMLSGNIECVSDPEVKVTGLLEIAGVAEDRIWVPSPTDFRIYPYFCYQVEIKSPDFPMEAVPDYSYVIKNDKNEYLWAEQSCFDCTIKGGYTEKPPFWDH